MLHRVALAAVGAVLAAGAIAVSSCEDGAPADTSPPAASGDASSVAASGTVTSGAGAMDAGVTPDAGAKECGEVAPGQWMAPTTGWTPVAWPNDCDVEIAANPAIALPPLEWVPCCAELPGCEHINVSWRYEDLAWPWMRVSVMPWGNGYRIGVAIQLTEYGAHLAGVYDETGTPMVAWRTKNHLHCGFYVPTVTTDRVWFGAYNTDVMASISAFVAPTWSELATVSSTIPITGGAQTWRAGKDLAVFWMIDGRTIQIYDLAAQQTYSYGDASVAYGYPELSGDHVVAYATPFGYDRQVGVWSRATKTMQVVYAPVFPDQVVNVHTDGQTLAWVVQPGPQLDGALWTSPLADTAQGLVPAARRPLARMPSQLNAANQDRYALVSLKPWMQPGPGDNRVHVYRLSDAHHWSFAAPDKWLWGYWDVMYLDAEYVFFHGPGPLARQRMAALGPGDPAP